MTIEQAQEYLETTYSAGRKKGIGAIRQALSKLGEPHKQLKIIHVAGTNGKGSFCAMMANVLKTAGFRAGMFTSPHLERMNERFSINGADISDADFVRILQMVISVSNEMFGRDDGFTFFEIFVLIAFVYFHEMSVDFFILEVGIGGRVDATNVVESPILSVIMAIGMDHMEILGDTIEEIAKEKGGIIKKNCPVVLYDDQVLVYNIFSEISGNLNAKIYHGRDVSMDGMEIGLLGEHQRKNAQVVIAACQALWDMGVHISFAHIKEGLATSRHAGRMEIISYEPKIILEGAHNLQGAQALAHSMRTIFADVEITLIMGILKDKEHHEIVNTLAPHAGRVIFTKPHYDFKAQQPEVLAAVLEANMENHVVQNCIEALQLAKNLTPTDGIIICTGSLYLIGDIRKFLRGDVND
ncbi:MAG: bifunctional folylpolyglutamate synthase/dihydrofolate synthase [Defluviitaleaceae bacterium]|nr:bifunctional folylpolyglutamate synthase/dihydrofolate synthase [Defluviitaleaceae bacterium]